MKTSTKRREQTNNGKIKNSHNNINKANTIYIIKNLKITPLLATHILYLTLVKVTSVIFFSIFFF